MKESTPINYDLNIIVGKVNNILDEGLSDLVKKFSKKSRDVFSGRIASIEGKYKLIYLKIYELLMAQNNLPDYGQVEPLEISETVTNVNKQVEAEILRTIKSLAQNKDEISLISSLKSAANNTKDQGLANEIIFNYLSSLDE